MWWSHNNSRGAEGGGEGTGDTGGIGCGETLAGATSQKEQAADQGYKRRGGGRSEGGEPSTRAAEVTDSLVGDEEEKEDAVAARSEKNRRADLGAGP